MADINREALGRVLMPVLDLLIEHAQITMSFADEDNLDKAMGALHQYLAPAEQDTP